MLGLQLGRLREQKVGAFSLALMGKDTNTGRLEIVEYQLERFDHFHLGQLLTCAGALDPSYKICIASQIREEPNASLEWLNSVFNSETFIFGIEVKAIRIRDSEPSPLLDAAMRPNSWTKQAQEIRAAAVGAERNKTYRRIWQLMTVHLAKSDTRKKNKKARVFLRSCHLQKFASER
jgi:hypothetical protein